MLPRGNPRQRVSRSPKMLRIPNALLASALRVAMLPLAPAAWVAPAAAPAVVESAPTQGGAAIAPVQHGAASLSQDHLSQDHIKALFFDAARQGRDDLLDGLIQARMKPAWGDPHCYTALVLA